MAIQDRGLKPGTMLLAKYKGKEHTAEVIAAKDSAVRYRLADGREFASPSAAGKAVMGGVACNGWKFWSLAGDRPATAAPQRPTGADTATKGVTSPTTPTSGPSANRAPTRAKNGSAKTASKTTAKAAKR